MVKSPLSNDVFEIMEYHIYTTRCGCKALVYATEVGNMKAIHGRVEHPELGISIVSWNDRGECTSNISYGNNGKIFCDEFDIVAVWVDAPPKLTVYEALKCAAQDVVDIFKKNGMKVCPTCKNKTNTCSLEPYFCWMARWENGSKDF